MFILEFYSNIHDINTSVPQFATTFRSTRIVVTLDLISEVLHVPRVAHLNYPSYKDHQTVSRAELLSHFCETPSTWGGKLNTPCSGFAKGSRFLNMVMTFTLTPLSNYNSITEPRARFLLSLLEDRSIDFPSHFITSILDMYLDMATCDKLIFPAIMCILTHFHSPIPSSPFFTTMGAINTGSIWRSKAQLRLKRPCVETDDLAASAIPPSSSAPSIFAHSSSVACVTLEAIMA